MYIIFHLVTRTQNITFGFERNSYRNDWRQGYIDALALQYVLGEREPKDLNLGHLFTIRIDNGRKAEGKK